MPAHGVCTGDRALYQGIGQRSGKQCDVIAARPVFAAIRFDDGQAVLALATDLHVVPRRPKPDF